MTCVYCIPDSVLSPLHTVNSFFELDGTQMLQMSMITNPIDQTVRTEITLHTDCKASVLATALCSFSLSEKSEWGEKWNQEACKIPS